MTFRIIDGGDRGRAVVATALLPAATRLLTTSPYAAVSLTACGWCFAAATSLKKCSGCRIAKYCSRRCQQDDWHTHGKECNAWSQIPTGQATQSVLLVARLAVKTLWVDPLSSETKTVLSLRHHHDDHTSSKLREFAEMAHLVALILSRSKSNVQHLDFDAIHARWHDAIVQLFCRVNCNAFTMCNDVNTPVGIGIFPQAAMLNHSCRPNCVVSFERDGKLSIRTIRPVQPQEEFTISYVDVLESTATRQAVLKGSYFFDCLCPRCHKFAEDHEEDSILDGILCEDRQCPGYIVVRDGEARCTRCESTGKSRQIVENLHHTRDLEAAVNNSSSVLEQWRHLQLLWAHVETTLRWNPRSTQFAKTARRLGNFLIDHGHDIPGINSSELALSFLERELAAIEWIEPDLLLPSRGLLHFQLAKLYSQVGRIDQSREHIRRSLSILSCVYSSHQPVLLAAQDFLRSLDE